MFLILGLGNPGVRYRWTRHNLGFLVIDAFALSEGIRWKKDKRLCALIGEKEEIVICKPLTYVNQSGKALTEVREIYRIEEEDMLVICDDLSLPLGRIRIRRKGGDGGHNGLRSIIASLKSERFARMRIGIKNSTVDSLPSSAIPEFVLSKFERDERKVVKETIKRAVEAIKVVIEQGIEEAMNRFNG